MVEKTTKEAKMTLASKLAKIGKEIGTVSKSGRNEQQKYDYIEYGVVAGRIRELFDDYGVIIIPAVTNYNIDEITNKYGNQGYHYVLSMQFTLINGDDPADIMTADWLGESADYGDKGINKAETAGTKYFLMRLFNISEKGEKEADAETPDIVSTTSRIDFKQVRNHLEELSTIEELNAYWQSLKLTEKQASALKPIFSERKVKIGAGVGV